MKENVDLWYVQTDIKVAQSRAILQGGTKSFDQNTLQKNVTLDNVKVLSSQVGGVSETWYGMG